MTIGIIGAMAQEIDGLVEHIDNIATTKISDIQYHRGTIDDVPVVVAQCGIGKVYAAVCAQTMIMTYEPDIIINIGVAGGHSSKTSIGDVVIATSAVQHDMDTSPIGDPVGMISGINMIHLPCEPNIANQMHSIASSMHIPCQVGVIASGDRFVCSAEDAKGISDTFGAIAYDMETASIAHVCYINSVAFGAIRSISDNGDESAHVDFGEFVDRTAQISISIICNYISSGNS